MVGTKERAVGGPRLKTNTRTILPMISIRSKIRTTLAKMIQGTISPGIAWQKRKITEKSDIKSFCVGFLPSWHRGWGGRRQWWRRCLGISINHLISKSAYRICPCKKKETGRSEPVVGRKRVDRSHFPQLSLLRWNKRKYNSSRLVEFGPIDH